MRKHLYRSLLLILPIFLLLVGCSSDAAGKNQLTIQWSDKEKPLLVKNANEPLAKILQKKGKNVAKLKQNYKPNVPWDKKITPGSVVKLQCKCTVNLFMGGKKAGTYKTTKGTVGGFLKEKKIPLTSWHELKTPPKTKITNGLNIVIDQYKQRVKKSVKQVPFEKVEKKDDELEKGKKKVKTEGKKGKKIFVMVENIKNGKVISTEDKQLVEELKPVEEVVLLGTKEPEPEEPEGPPESGEKMTVEATAYTHTGNPTATGTMPKHGTIAVDPDVIPLGTRMYIPGYGYGVAEDTGGAVDGKIIDLFMNTEEQCRQWGRRTVEITILD